MATASLQPADTLIQAVRRFNRFYTRQIGVLHEGLLQSQFSLTEVRVLYELGQREHSTAAEFSEVLGLDPGYLSRILRGFQARGLISRQASKADARQTLLTLTGKGKETFQTLDTRSNREVGTMLDRLSPGQRSQLVTAMQKIEQVLGGDLPNRAPYLLRTHQPGDMGWVVYRHGAIYAGEYGYSEEFEALVAEIVAHFLQHFDAARERCWIAERDGEIVGSIFLVKKSNTVAKLRLLLVEPTARGLGIGKRLISECVRFARQAGYKKITLWTQSELLAARRLYEAAGFRLVSEKPHQSFGKDLVAETWELKL
jgi:DNA-binding MarR family transcriptional regulator/GNAT superfamily N-acetyltransferase